MHPMKQFDKMPNDFIWKNKPHYMRKEIECNSNATGVPVAQW